MDKTIFDDGELRAELYRPRDLPRRSPPVAVTFESVVIKLKNGPFAQTLARKRGWPILHVIPTKPTWYHEPSIPKCLKKIGRRVGADTFSYGSSMGGYAAACFADALGLRHAVAISPQAGLHPTGQPFERRWSEYRHHFGDQGEGLPPERRALLWLFYDPEHDMDNRHAQQLAEAGPTHLIRVPYAAHPVGNALVEMGLMSWVIDEIVGGNADPVAMNETIAAAAHKSPTLLFAKARHFEGEERLNIAQRAFEIDPDRVRVRFKFGLELLRAGRRTDADDMLRPLMESGRIAGKNLKKYTSLCKKLDIEPELLRVVPVA